MKIGIIAHLKHPIIAPFAGGLEVFTHQITSLLGSRGHQVTLFASSSSDSNLPLDPILSDDYYDKSSGLRIKRKDLPSEYIAEHHAYFELMMKLDSYGLDVVFNNSLHYIPITMASLIDTPMLTVLHTPPFYELSLAIKAERVNPVVNYATVSQFNAKNWSALIQDCEVIPNGIDLSEWSAIPHSTHQEPYAVWFGRIHPDKGLQYAINACKKAGIKLKIAGGIADQKYFKNEIEPLLHEKIELLGLLERKALQKLIANAQVCVVTPTWQEPFGLVIAEAMATGTPVAGFRMGALSELINPSCGILVDFADTDALAKAILEAQQLNRETIGRYASEQFDIETMITHYEHLLNVVADKSRTKIFTI
ncbi:glycosyltransferase [Pedobacter aquatilis]|uniref:glycosyltransferase n=1 Tax=Pedobacter aquatilis TaxID=351343 RepID=UPI0025B436E8|nr:glycosyltransferase [Pedobacter aquatilis]MDN3586237.1 glycosyltransferase [Pedobacter aquatilis]